MKTALWSSRLLLARFKTAVLVPIQYSPPFGFHIFFPLIRSCSHKPRKLKIKNSKAFSKQNKKPKIHTKMSNLNNCPFSSFSSSNTTTTNTERRNNNGNNIDDEESRLMRMMHQQLPTTNLSILTSVRLNYLTSSSSSLSPPTSPTSIPRRLNRRNTNDNLGVQRAIEILDLALDIIES